MVERLTDRDAAQRSNALEQLKSEISGATKTMTSVPKPLKFLSPQYEAIKAAYEAEKDANLKVRPKNLLACLQCDTHSDFGSGSISDKGGFAAMN